MFGKKAKERHAELMDELDSLFVQMVNMRIEVNGTKAELASLRKELKQAKANPQTIRTKSVHVTLAR